MKLVFCVTATLLCCTFAQVYFRTIPFPQTGPRGAVTLDLMFNQRESSRNTTLVLGNPIVEYRCRSDSLKWGIHVIGILSNGTWGSPLHLSTDDLRQYTHESIPEYMFSSKGPMFYNLTTTTTHVKTITTFRTDPFVFILTSPEHISTLDDTPLQSIINANF